MKIVIAGAGEVGFHLIENLCREKNDIYVVDIQKAVLEQLKAEFRIHTDHGDIITSKFLHPTHLHNTDLFMAITNSDETNMIACKAASEAGARKTICRIRQVSLNSEKKPLPLKSLGIDWVINPVSLVADELSKRVLTPNIIDNHEFAGGAISMTGYQITDYSRICNRSIRQLEIDPFRGLFYVGIIQRKEMSFIPDKDEVVQSGDVLYFFYDTRHFQRLRKILGYHQLQTRSRQITINGGGHMGLRVAQRLEKADQYVRVIEKRLARSYHISEHLQRSLVLNFDGTDLKQLIAESIESSDYFISVTDNEQVNITSCLLAEQLGVAHTICLVKQPELVQIIDQSTPIDIGISPRVLTARHLIRYIQDSSRFSFFSILNSHMEILEVRIHDASPCTGRPLRQIEFPQEVRVAVIFRDKRFLVPDGDTVMAEGDVVLLILHQLDRLKALALFTGPVT